MLWLKRIDPLSRLVPAGFLKGRRPASGRKGVAVLRPGGLGDLVLLSRAAMELGVDLQSVHWICEQRNAPWARYLALPHSCYDNFQALAELLSGRTRFDCVVNSEQTFGLSTLYSARLCASGGRHIGFSSNRRADLYSNVVNYSQGTHELESFKSLLLGAELSQGASRSEISDSGSRRGSSSLCIVALAGLQLPSKRLSIEAWRRLIRAAEAKFGDIRLVGAPGDIGFANQLGLESAGRVDNLVGKLSFERVVELIRDAERLISVDSGLVHVADFFGVPSTVYFPSGNPAKWSPLTLGSRVYQPTEEESFLTLA